MSGNDTTHDDLMDISSRWTYEDLEVNPKSSIKMNGHLFAVVDKVNDPVTGLDAYTFKNKATGELTVGFVGTDFKQTIDVVTDATLITSATPAQYAAAQKYVDKIEANPKFGKVTSVCGNSLGGGIAAYVAATRPGMIAVTVNPAPVPEKMVGARAKNVYNYISTETDVLHGLVVPAGLQRRIIGQVIPIAGTHPGWGAVLENHIGSDREAGAYDASMAVPFSVFHDNQVVGAGGFGSRVKIDLDALDRITGALTLQHGDQLALVDSLLTETHTALESYTSQTDRREQATKEAFEDLLHAPIIVIMKGVGTVRAHLRQITHVVGLIVAPLPLQFVWRRCEDLLIAVVDKIIADVVHVSDLGIETAAQMAWSTQESLFTQAARQIARTLGARNLDLQHDMKIITARWDTLNLNTSLVRTQITHLDTAMAAAVAARTGPPTAITAHPPPWPPGTVDTLEGDGSKAFADWVTRTRDEAASTIITGIATVIADQISTRAVDVLSRVVAGIEALQGAFVTITAIIESAIEAADNPFGELVGIDHHDVDRLQTEVRNLREDVYTQSEAIQRTLADITATLHHLPDVTRDLLPDLTQGIFADTTIDETLNAYTKCDNLIERCATTCAEIHYQLTSQTSLAITTLANRADHLHHDLTTTGTNLTQMIS